VERTDVEFVVVGAGALGLGVARALARRGREVVVCEQAGVGHGGGGSKGSARIFRLGYDQPWYIRMAMASARLWAELEEESGTRLLVPTGQVTFGPALHLLVDSMAAAGAPCEEIAASEVAARFPMLQAGGPAVFEPASGVLVADACLAALRTAAKPEVREATRVLGLEEDGRRCSVLLETPEGRGELRATGAVVCAGPWTERLLGPGAGLGLRATLEQVLYVGSEAGAGAAPVFVERSRPWFYGLPVPDTGLVKLSLHGAGPEVAIERLDEAPVGDDPGLVGELMEAARRVVPELAVPVRTERCLYDNSPDTDFVLDRRGALTIGAGTSGHGFKFAPLLGELLADLATGSREWTSVVDVGRFRPSRYTDDVR
jgi:sarcosine oxidase